MEWEAMEEREGNFGLAIICGVGISVFLWISIFGWFSYIEEAFAYIRQAMG